MSNESTENQQAPVGQPAETPQTEAVPTPPVEDTSQTEPPAHSDLVETENGAPIPAAAEAPTATQTKLSQDQLRSLEGLMWDFNKFTNNAACFSRSKWIVEQSGYFDAEGKLQVSYMPSSSESVTIGEIAAALGWQH